MSATSILHKEPLIKTNSVITKPQMAVNIPSFTSIKTVQISATAPTAAVNNESIVTFRFDAKQLGGRVKAAWVRYTITNSDASNEMKCEPVPYFCSKIEYFANDGTSLLYTQRDNTSFWEVMALTPEDQQSKSWRQDLNVSAGYYHSHDQHKRSVQRAYRLPLITNPLVLAREHLGAAVGDIYIKFHFQKCEISGNHDDVQLDDISLEFEIERLSADDEKQVLSLKNQASLHRFLEPMKVEYASQTLTASTKSTFSLDSVVGDCPFILFCVRSATTVGNRLKTVNLGPTATVDIEDSTGRSIYGGGQAVRLDLIMKHLKSKHFRNPEFIEQRNFYVLPFCDSVQDSFAGSKHGYFRFDGSNYKLAITPSAAGTSAVQTLNCNNPANDGGYYKLAFMGDITDSLAYNANATAIKAALEALPTMLDWQGAPLTVTASDALTTDATLTFAATANPQPNSEKHQVQVICESINDGGVAEFTSTSTTTLGVPGFTTGSYTVSIYPYLYRRLWSKNGKYKVDNDI